MVNIRVQAGSTLSNVDIIKLHLYFDGPATEEELAQEVCRLMRANVSVEKALERYVRPVLASQPIFRKSGDKYELDIEKLPEHKVVHKVLADERKFLSEKDLKSKVAKELGIKVNCVALDATRIPGLKQQGKRWGLEHWRLVNDEAFKLMKERPGSISESEIIKLVVGAGLASEKEAIFDPFADSRFKRDRKNWRLAGTPASEPKAGKVKPRPAVSVDRNLESEFIRAQIAKEREKQQKAGKPSGELKKVLIKKIVSEKIKEREPVAAQEVVSGIAPVLEELHSGTFGLGGDFDKVTSFQRVEDSPREMSLSPKERTAINEFLERLVSDSDIVPLSDHPIKLGGPLSAPKVERIVYHRYKDYSTRRCIIPEEFNRMLVEILAPKLSDLVLNPAAQAGALAVAVLNYINEQMLGIYWALGDNDSVLLVSQKGARLTLDARDTPLIEKAKEEFVVNRNDLIGNFISFNFCGIETDPILFQAARIITRLSGFEDVYIVNRDFLTELPEIFGQPPNPENDIDLLFQVILGNLTFRGEQSLVNNFVANYIDQACRIVAADGRIGFFVNWDFLQLLEGHEFLDMILSRQYFKAILRLPAIQSDIEPALVVIEPREAEEIPDTLFAVINSSSDIPKVLAALQGSEASDFVRRIPAKGFSEIFR
ncbi:MAG: hypothetical protein HRF49_02920 [bacterium]|jgi:hypothetical protein